MGHLLTPRVAILDYGCGNLASVANAVRKIGGEPWIWGGNLKDFAATNPTHLILPGQGHYQSAATDALLSVKYVRRDDLPILGICLGMQLMCEGSEEAPGVKGLGWIPTHCVRLHRRRLPVIGWQDVPLPRQADQAAFYFCHSYGIEGWPTDYHPGNAPEGWETCWVLDTERPRIAAWCLKGTLWAVQFHPEKSGRAGLALLAEFLKL